MGISLFEYLQVLVLLVVVLVLVQVVVLVVLLLGPQHVLEILLLPSLVLVLPFFLLLPPLLVLLLFLLDCVEVDHDLHFISDLCLSLCLFPSYLLESSIDHLEDVIDLLLFLDKLGHQVYNFLLQLLIVVCIRHSTSLQLLLNFL